MNTDTKKKSAKKVETPALDPKLAGTAQLPTVGQKKAKCWYCQKEQDMDIVGFDPQIYERCRVCGATQ